MKFLASLMRFGVLIMMYFVLYKIVKTMYLDVKINKSKLEDEVDFAIELIDCPENMEIAKGSIYPVRKTLDVGRGEDNDVYAKDPFMSAHHASLFINDDKLYIKDVGSTNGTFKNDEQIEFEDELIEGDIIKIGRLVFKVIG